MARNTQSITAVVISVILANPSKLFNLAIVIFKTSEFFRLDSSRITLESNNFHFGYSGNSDEKIFDDERREALRKTHRKESLEFLAIKYQFSINQDDANVKTRQEIIWKILDNYHSELKEESKRLEENKIWRLYLARMDTRKMNLVYEKRVEGTLIKFIPELEPDLKEMSEESSKTTTEFYKYMDLKWWAENRFKRNEDKYKKYETFENNIKLVISELREILDKLKNEHNNRHLLFYGSTPAYVCAVLLRDFFDALNEDERESCKRNIDILLLDKTLPQKYSERVHDLAKPIIATLPIILKNFPEDRDKIKRFLLLSLIKPTQNDTAKLVVNVVRNTLWELSFESAQSIFLAYLLLKPKFNKLENDLREKHYEIFEFSDISDDVVLAEFLAKYNSDIENFISNNIVFEDFEYLHSLGLNTLLTAFKLLPIEIENKKHKQFVTIISQVFAEKLLITNHQNKVDYNLRDIFFTKFAYIVLNSTKEEIENYINPFVERFVDLEAMNEMFKELINAEDRLGKYEEFWFIWNKFYDKVVEAVKTSNSIRTEKLIRNYLFADEFWGYSNDWHSLKEKDKIFFTNIVKDIGHHPTVLFCLAKFVYDVGSKFLEDSIYWISDLLNSNTNLLSDELEKHTDFYVESLIRKYILTNRLNIRTRIEIKNRVVTILNFLVQKGSVDGYLLRESIL